MLIRLVVLYAIGFVTWLLTFGRSLAWDHRRVGWLCGIVAMDELAGIGIGMYLARHGTWVEAVVVATGGVTAAFVLSRRIFHVGTNERTESL